MYILATTIAVLISYLVTIGVFKNADDELMHAFSPSRVDWTWFFESISFTHWNRVPILGVGWSLQIEFLFYLAIAFGLMLGAIRLDALIPSVLGFFFVLISFGSINTSTAELLKSLPIHSSLNFFWVFFFTRSFQAANS